MITLNIQTINSNIILNKEDAQFSIDKQVNFSIDKREHRFDIYIRNSELEIHNYPAYKQLNYKNVMDLAFEAAGASMQAGKEAIAEYSSDGDQMMRIENKGDVIPAIAEQKAQRFSGDTVNIAYFPNEPIDINFSPSQVTSNYEPGAISVNSTANLDIRAGRANVNVSVDRPFQVIVNPVGSNIDYTV